MQKHFLFFIFLFFPAFAKAQDTNQAFRIGNIVFTYYELNEKYLSEHISLFNNPDELFMQINEFLKKSYIITHLYDIHYDKNANVTNIVSSTEQEILTQQNGPLIQHLYDKSIGEILKNSLEHLQKRKIQYKFKVIEFPYSNKYNFSSDNYPPVSFSDLLAKSNKDSLIRIYETTIKWPFFQYYNAKDIIYSLNPGDIGGPFYKPESVVFLYCLEKTIRNTNIKEINQTEYFIGIRNGYKASIMQKANVKIDFKIVEKLFNYINEDGFSIELDPTVFPIDKPIMKYNYNDLDISVSVGDLSNYYNKNFIKYRLMNNNILINYLLKIVTDKYFLADADKYGITTSIKFQLDKLNYTHITMISQFKKEISNSFIISNNILRKYYAENIIEFITNYEVTISYVECESRNEANSIGSKIVSAENDTINEMQTDFINTIVTYSSVDPDGFINTIFRMPVNSIKYPILHNGKYCVVIKKSESGQRQQSFEEVRDKIDSILREQKTQQYLDSLYVELVKQYPIENNIDIEKCREYLENLKNEQPTQPGMVPQ